MKISLVIPPSHLLINDRVFPALGPLQIAATARTAGYCVEVIDLSGYRQRHPANDASFENVCAEAKAILNDRIHTTDVIGFYATVAQYQCVVDLMKYVNELHPNIITMLGGPYANIVPQRCVEDRFDYVVVSDQGGGGGERGFLAALDHCNSHSRHDWPLVMVQSRIDGVKWQNDVWPFPARDLIDLDSYVYHINGERATSMITSTGCPFACSFCTHWCGYRKQESKSPEYVRREIKGIKQFGIRGIMFYDDEINLREGFDEVLDVLREENIVWRAFFKSGKNLLNERIFEKMAASGCSQLCTGVESADDNILRATGKNVTVSDNELFIKLCVKHKIAPKVFAQVGLPGETHETVTRLHDWLIEMVSLGLKDADVSITTPYEGTPIYRDPDKYDIEFERGTDFSKKHAMYKGVPGEYESHVWNSVLSRGDIVQARDWIESDFRKVAGLTDLLIRA